MDNLALEPLNPYLNILQKESRLRCTRPKIAPTCTETLPTVHRKHHIDAIV